MGDEAKSHEIESRGAIARAGAEGEGESFKMIVNTIFAGAALCALAVVAAGAGSRETPAVEEQAHVSEHFAAYCIGVFGADQTSLKSRFVPTCLTNEAADQCSARIADIDQKRHRVDLTLRELQDSLATRGIIAPERYTRLAKYLVAASCWEGL